MSETVDKNCKSSQEEGHIRYLNCMTENMKFTTRRHICKIMNVLQVVKYRGLTFRSYANFKIWPLDLFLDNVGNPILITLCL